MLQRLSGVSALCCLTTTKTSSQMTLRTPPRYAVQLRFFGSNFHIWSNKRSSYGAGGVGFVIHAAKVEQMRGVGHEKIRKCRGQRKKKKLALLARSRPPPCLLALPLCRPPLVLFPPSVPNDIDGLRALMRARPSSMRSPKHQTQTKPSTNKTAAAPLPPSRLLAPTSSFRESPSAPRPLSPLLPPPPRPPPRSTSPATSPPSPSATSSRSRPSCGPGGCPPSWRLSRGPGSQA